MSWPLSARGQRTVVDTSGGQFDPLKRTVKRGMGVWRSCAAMRYAGRGQAAILVHSATGRLPKHSMACHCYGVSACASVSDADYRDTVSLLSAAFHLHMKGCRARSYRLASTFRGACVARNRSQAALARTGHALRQFLTRAARAWCFELDGARRRMRRSDRCWQCDRRTCEARCGGARTDCLIGTGTEMGVRRAPDCCNRGNLWRSCAPILSFRPSLARPRCSSSICIVQIRRALGGMKNSTRSADLGHEPHRAGCAEVTRG